MVFEPSTVKKASKVKDKQGAKCSVDETVGKTKGWREVSTELTTDQTKEEAG